ncbi:hypothetical protein KC347_g44 [Hortaea werneckii]|nr:hypothetical protein KC347_g44 [Hortaea werneckii]
MYAFLPLAPRPPLKDIERNFSQKERRGPRQERGKALGSESVHSGTDVGSSAESRVRTFFIVLLLPLREDFLDRAERLVPLRSLAAGVDREEFLPWSLDRFRVMTSPPSLSEESSSYSSSPLSSGCSRSGV